MIKSMTGFGKAEAVLGGKKIGVEMKSLNHRYLEISLRAPAILAPFEIDIKKKIGEQFSRGRIEVMVRIDEGEDTENEGQMTLNLPRARYYYDLMRQLQEALNLPGEITLAMMTGMKDIFVPKETDTFACLDMARTGKRSSWTPWRR